jgi:LmbE family N-acetylglucosaminyl deacetylase
MLCLEIAESGVFDGADWEQPLATEFGLGITQNRLSDITYRENFDTLKNKLREHLRGCENVFTHNPWGEYGHVEHVQVYRAVKALQNEMQFTIWFSNYVSNKSARLMANALPRIDTQIRLPTDKRLAEQIAGIYKANECWTWYDDYEWCDDEVFVRDSGAAADEERFGTLLPLNLIKIEIPSDKSERPSMVGRIIARLTRNRSE